MAPSSSMSGSSFDVSSASYYSSSTSVTSDINPCCKFPYRLLCDLPLEHTTENAFNKRKGSESLGVLNNFDLASEIGEDGEFLVSAPHYRTGTLLFMARDLLKPVPAKNPALKHLYRHDLESFLYILVWAAIHYEINEKNRRPTPQSLQNWLDPNYAHDSKASFIYTPARYTEVRSHRRSEYEALWKKWIDPLRMLLFEADVDAGAHLVDGRPFDYDTYNGKITFHSFMTAIGQDPPDFDSIAVEEEN